MELIQIDSVNIYSSLRYISQSSPLPIAVFVDAETGVVYFNGMYPRYDANGRIMVIPKDQLPAIIAQAKARAADAAGVGVGRTSDITQV